eukprot:6124309-Pyramimonas_sp.AAC.1
MSGSKHPLHRARVVAFRPLSDALGETLKHSEEYRRHLQGALYGTRGAQPSKTLVTNVVSIQDSQERAPCATFWFLGLIQVPHEAP